MKHVSQSYEVLDRRPKEDIYKKIERIARVCYKSEDKIGPGTAERMVQNLVSNGHWAMLEHDIVSVLWTVSRSVSHAMVRHRIASMAQESTQYCDYASGRLGGEITYIEYEPFNEEDARVFREVEGFGEYSYKSLRALGIKPVIARDVLAHSLKTELVTTFNLSQWRHFLEMRADPADSPQMRSIVGECLSDFRAWMPEIFLSVEPYSEQVRRERDSWSVFEEIERLVTELPQDKTGYVVAALYEEKIKPWLDKRKVRMLRGPSNA
jgi:thymidylate synthase (FAD)